MRPWPSRSPRTPDADEVLSESPFALLAGMLLDQQFPMEHAFAGPAKILDRFGTLDPAAIAAADPEEFAALCATPPAVHRFPGSMAARVQALAAHVVDEYDGHTERLWEEADSGTELLRRLQALPASASRRRRSSSRWSASSSASAPTAGRRRPATTPRPGRSARWPTWSTRTSLEKVRAFKKEKKARPPPTSLAIRPGTDVGVLPWIPTVDVSQWRRGS